MPQRSSSKPEPALVAYAHSANDAGEWHDLAEHLKAVAERCSEFADAFGAREFGHWLGLWHDVGEV